MVSYKYLVSCVVLLSCCKLKGVAMAFDYIIEISSVVISVGVAYIAWVQYKTNDLKLRLDLYNRRFDIYRKAVIYYLDCTYLDREKVKVKKSNYDFVVACREARFIFGEETGICEQLELIMELTAEPEINFSALLDVLVELENKMESSLSFKSVHG